MHRIFSITMIVIVILLAGCAGNYPKYIGADATCIQGTNPEARLELTSGEGHVQINLIDGISTGRDSSEQLCLASGRHKIEGWALARGKVANFNADFDLKAGRRYLLRADYDQAFIISDHARFKLEFLDITSDLKIKIKEFELVGEKSYLHSGRVYRLTD